MRKIFVLITPALLLAAPKAPSNLVLKALSQSEVSISWHNNAITQTGYKIFRDGSLIAVVGANVTSYKDTKLTKNTTYTYTVKASDDRSYKNILFAHGYQSSSSTWDYFANYITGNGLGWNIYRTSVGKTDHISVRATQLASYINSNSDKIADNSLVVLGHSMGGLDLRYIINEAHKHQVDKNNIFYKATKKINKLYTFATPHKGINDDGIDDATDDMTKPNMKIFNESNPYSNFNIDDRKIPLLAYRFVCDDERTSDGSGSRSDSGYDGLLKVKTQIFNNAPYTQTVFSGEHSDGLCLNAYEEELKRTDLLDGILQNQEPYTDRADVVFYEDNECKGEEAGVFSSTYPAGGVNCLTDSGCDDNKISSVRLFPGLKNGTIIELYSDHDDDGGDDWAILEVKSTLAKPICISTFENNIDDNKIRLEYHEKLGIENGLDGKISYIKITR